MLPVVSLGNRSRVEFDQSVGDLTYSSLLLDYRQYWMPKRPYTIAVRAVHFGRYGQDAESPYMVDYYAGYPELVRGYNLSGTDATGCGQPSPTGNCVVYNNLRGSRLLVANIEVRAPLLGVIKGDMTYGRFPVEVAGFFDAGLTWSSGQRPALAGGDRPVMRSVGVAARANIFGFLIVELSAAHPFDRGGGGIQWQLGIKQGF